MQSKPTILILNGTSSAGKTSIAKHFQEAVTEQWMLITIDSFISMFPSTMNEHWAPLSQFSRSFYKTVALWAQEGYNVILDTVFDSPDCFSNCVESLSQFRVYLIGVHCPLEILIEREKERGDREIGLAQRQFGRVHTFCGYDLELNSSSLSVEECSGKICELLVNVSDPSSFK